MHALDEWLRNSLRPAFFGLLALVMAAGAGVSGYKIGLPEQKIDKLQPMVTPTPPSAPVTQNDSTRKAEEFRPTQPTGPIYVEGDKNGVSLAWPIGVCALALLKLGALSIRRATAAQLVIEDSDAFKEAQRIWLPIATMNNGSPRAIKRFGNRVRYLCMLQRVEDVDDRLLAARIYDTIQWLKAWINRRLGRAESVSSQATALATGKQTALREHRMVVLTAIYNACGQNWREVASRCKSDEEGVAQGQLMVAKSFDAYCIGTGADWPFSEDVLNAFQRTLDGVRISGDVQRDDAAQSQPSDPEGHPEKREGRDSEWFLQLGFGNPTSGAL